MRLRGFYRHLRPDGRRIPGKTPPDLSEMNQTISSAWQPVVLFNCSANKKHLTPPLPLRIAGRKWRAGVHWGARHLSQRGKGKTWIPVMWMSSIAHCHNVLERIYGLADRPPQHSENLLTGCTVLEYFRPYAQYRSPPYAKRKRITLVIIELCIRGPMLDINSNVRGLGSFANKMMEYTKVWPAYSSPKVHSE